MSYVVEVIKKEYWSKADAFMLPLLGLQKNERYEISSYLFWEKHSIEDFKLVLSVSYDKSEDFLMWCHSRLFPTLDKKGLLLESHDYPGRTVFVVDMSEWALDIEMFIAGRYSQFSRQAKGAIENYHTFNGNQIPIHIYASLHPNMRMSRLTDGKTVMTPIEYVAKNYEFDLEEMRKIGEIGGIIEPVYETLYAEINDICQNDIRTE